MTDNQQFPITVIDKLQQMAKQSALSSAVVLVHHGVDSNVTISSKPGSKWVILELPNEIVTAETIHCESWMEAFSVVSLRFEGATLKVESVGIKATSKATRSTKDLLQLAVAAWCEVFGLTVPTEAELKSKRTAAKRELEDLKKIALDELRGGGHGVAKWNSRTVTEKLSVGSLKGTDFSGLNLAGVSFSGCHQDRLVREPQLDLEGTNFDGGTLSKASMDYCRLRKASFKKVQMDRAICRNSTFSGADFSSASLQFASFHGSVLNDANFDGANLSDVDFEIAKLKASSFKNATMNNLQCQWAQLDEANFSGASMIKARLASSFIKKCLFIETNLGGADLSMTHLEGSNFAGANLQGCNLQQAIVTGVDFSTANLDGAVFTEARWDETTRFPLAYETPTDMRWVGKGLDPTKIVKFSQSGDPFQSFMNELIARVDSSRLDKAVSMLKADTFELFSEVSADSVIGVVKSQKDPELVYSARVCEDGTFSCCTQNLFPCGGLRGSLCKHLLVLLIGLTKSGQLDITKARHWVQSTSGCQPRLEKQIMTTVFLKYKGAEAGEVDWRPVETIPEDYYAL